jgi:hypothetical protein
MFQYTHALEIKQKEPCIPMLFQIGKSIKPWHGPNVFQVFGIKAKWKLSLFLFLQKRCYCLFSFRPLYSYSSSYNKNKGFYLSHFHEGYYQDVNMVNHVKEQVTKTFVFQKSLLNEKTKQIVSKKVCENSISIHVRRMNHLELSDTFGTISSDYYRQACDYIQEKTYRGTIYVFSDDIAWCKENLGIPNVIFVDWNTGNDYWQDMCLMSCCRHNVIANSTFSWWAAWLNTYSNKIIIAPRKWKKTIMVIN